MSGIHSEITRNAKRQKKKSHTKENNQSIETDTDVRIAEKDTTTVTATVLHMFKKLSRNWKILKKPRSNF